VDLEDLSAAGAVGRLDGDPAVEAAGAQQRRIEHIRAIGRRQNDHRLARVEAVHLDQQLVERLLALVVPTEHIASTAPPPDRAQLVDEDDRRCGLLGLGEQVAHTGCADADHDLDELRAAHTEERHVGLAGHRAR
jgi:glucuronate isomerase